MRIRLSMSSGLQSCETLRQAIIIGLPQRLSTQRDIECDIQVARTLFAISDLVPNHVALLMMLTASSGTCVATCHSMSPDNLIRSAQYAHQKLHRTAVGSWLLDASGPQCSTGPRGASSALQSVRGCTIVPLSAEAQKLTFCPSFAAGGHAQASREISFGTHPEKHSVVAYLHS